MDEQDLVDHADTIGVVFHVRKTFFSATKGIRHTVFLRDLMNAPSATVTFPDGSTRILVLAIRDRRVGCTDACTLRTLESDRNRVRIAQRKCLRVCCRSSRAENGRYDVWPDGLTGPTPALTGTIHRRAKRVWSCRVALRPVPPI